jgi:hypothetical protein
MGFRVSCGFRVTDIQNLLFWTQWHVWISSWISSFWVYSVRGSHDQLIWSVDHRLSLSWFLSLSVTHGLCQSPCLIFYLSHYLSLSRSLSSNHSSLLCTTGCPSPVSWCRYQCLEHCPCVGPSPRKFRQKKLTLSGLHWLSVSVYLPVVGDFRSPWLMIGSWYRMFTHESGT